MYRSRLAQRRRKRNAALPINFLPDEILLTVIDQAVDEPVSLSPRESRYRRLRRMRSVCFRWNLLVDASPAVWSLIHYVDGFRAVSRALSKLKDIPVDVVYANGREDESMSHPFLDAVIYHANRWRSAKLAISTHDELYRLVYLKVSNLKRLELSAEQYLVPQDFFVGETGSLRHLRLSSIAIPWDVDAGLDACPSYGSAINESTGSDTPRLSGPHTFCDHWAERYFRGVLHV